MITELPVKVIGHCLITDDLGNIVLNQSNAIHPTNISRVISRALSHEDNCWIDRIAFGNGGTYYAIENNKKIIKYKHVNDGNYPDINQWNSTLYNEAYSEKVDIIIPSLGSNNTEYINNDHTTSGIGCVSIDRDRISQVIISCTLGNNEPTGQYDLDYDHNSMHPESSFIFDEIGLYTSGSPLKDTNGFQIVELSKIRITDDTKLLPDHIYHFDISINNSNFIPIRIDTSNISMVSYAQLIILLNNELIPKGVEVFLTDGTNITNKQTYGNLKFQSSTIGDNSYIIIKQISKPNNNWLFKKLNGFVKFGLPEYGDYKWYQNKPNNSSKECERLLTHLIFSPILKSSNRLFNIKYTLTIYVNRTSQLPVIDIIKSQNHYSTNDEIISNLKIYRKSNDACILHQDDSIISKDVVTFFNNIVYQDDVWSIGGIGINNIYYENINNYRSNIPYGMVLSNTKLNIISNNMVNGNNKLNISTELSNITFSQIDVYSNGVPASNTNGYQIVTLNTSNLAADTGLKINETYSLQLLIDGVISNIPISTSGYSIITYQTLLTIFNTIPNIRVIFDNNTFKFISNTSGDNSTIKIMNSDSTALFNNVHGFIMMDEQVYGKSGFDYNRTGEAKNTPMILYSLKFSSPVILSADDVYYFRNLVTVVGND